MYNIVDCCLTFINLKLLSSNYVITAIINNK